MKITELSELISANTDELLAIGVTGATLVGYFLSMAVPTEPMMIVLGFYFGRKVVS